METIARFSIGTVATFANAIRVVDMLIEIQRDFEYRNIVFEAQAEMVTVVLFGIVSIIDFVWIGCANRAPG